MAIPSDTTRDVGRLGRLLADLTDRVAKLEPMLGTLNRGSVESGSVTVRQSGTISTVGPSGVTSLFQGYLACGANDGSDHPTSPSVVLGPGAASFTNASGATAQVNVDPSTGALNLGGSANLIRMIGLPSTGSAANMRYDPSSQVVQQVTSSLKYKQDVEDVEVDPAAVLQMVGRTWRDRADVERDPETETRYVGFIAEELHDIGLGRFVEYDEDDQPNAIAYDRLSVALLEVAKSQEARLKALEEKVGLATPPSPPA